MVDRVPEELWMEVCNTVQEAVTKTSPKKKKFKKAKWLSEEASQMVKKRRKVKGKGERERYPQLNEDTMLFYHLEFLSYTCGKIP